VRGGGGQRRSTWCREQLWWVISARASAKAARDHGGRNEGTKEWACIDRRHQKKEEGGGSFCAGMAVEAVGGGVGAGQCRWR
jgi:hypothetical protein